MLAIITRFVFKLNPNLLVTFTCAHSCNAVGKWTLNARYSPKAKLF